MFTCTSASCDAAVSAAMLMCTTAVVLNSCNAAASSGGTRAYYNDLSYSRLEEGRRNSRPAPLAAADAAAGGRREAKPGCCPLGPAWKMAIRSVVFAAWLLATAFLVSLLLMCKSWSDAFVWLASLVMVTMMAAVMMSFTLDCVTDPEYHRKRTTS